MKRLVVTLSVVALIGCVPPECAPDAPVPLASISGLRMEPTTNSVVLSSGTKSHTDASKLTPGYACPAFDLKDAKATLGPGSVAATFEGGTEWRPGPIIGPPGASGAGDGVCTCSPAVLGVVEDAAGAVPSAPLSADRFDVTISQGATQIEAGYANVSNSVQVVEETSASEPANRRRFRFSSGFNRTYTLVQTPTTTRGPWGTNVKVTARYRGAEVAASVLRTNGTSVAVDLAGPADTFTFEVDRIFHDIQPSDCRGPATCAPLRVIAPRQTLTL